MINERVDHFSFFQPVIFTLDDNLGTTTFSKYLWTIGSLADQFASLSQKTISVDAEKINARKFYFEVEEVHDVPMWQTALKVALWICSFGTLLAATLVIKTIFKRSLNQCKVLTKASPNEVFAEKQIGKTKIVLLYGSVTDENTDAIVNAANAYLAPGSGVCGAIHDDAGDKPFEECDEILEEQDRKKLKCGEVVMTSSGELAPRIKAIVHAVGPDYRIKKQKEHGDALLKAAYRNSMAISRGPKRLQDYVSEEMKGKVMHSIAFPSISTGIYKAPLDEAAPIALNTVKEFVEEYPDAFEEVRFVFLPLSQDKDTAPAYELALIDL